MTDELSKGFTGIEINGVRFSNIGEMLRYMDKQRQQLTKAKEIIKKFLLWENDWHEKTESKYKLLKQAEQFLKDSEVEK